MRIFLFCILTLVVGLSWAPEKANAEPTNCDLMSELLLFISQTADLATIESCPSIRAASADTLLSSVVFAHPAASHQPEAVYLPADNVILISSEIDRGGAIGRSFLVHELVHALQFQTGAADLAPCVGQLEAEAYRVQSEFLKRQGLTDQALAIRSFSLVVGSCAQAYHPDF